MSEDKFEALCDFLKTHGADKLDPIWVKKDGVDGFEVIDGEHRWRAAKAAGWKRMRSFAPLDIDADNSRAFNVRKNRERGNIDAIKFGKILVEECEQGKTMNQISKTYGLGERRVRQYKEIFRRKDEILASFGEAHPAPLITLSKGDRVLRELKHPETEPKETEQAVKEIEKEHTPTIQDVQITSLDKALEAYEKALLKIQPKENETNKEFMEKATEQAIRGLIRKHGFVCPSCGQNIMEIL